MSDLTRIFTPTNEDGSPDQRFNDDINWVFNRVGSEVIEGLERFQQETTKVNNNSTIINRLNHQTTSMHTHTNNQTKRIRFWSEGEISNEALNNYKVIGQRTKDKMLSPSSVNGYSILNLKIHDMTNTSSKPKINTKRLLIADSKTFISTRNNDLSISNRVKRKTLKIK